MKVRSIALAVATVVSMTVVAAPAAAAAESATRCAINLETQRVACRADAEQARADVGAAASVKITTMYDGINYGGTQYSYYVASGCTPSYSPIEWQVSSMGSWDNRMSSVKTFNRCDVKLYQLTGFRGEVSVWIDSASNLGTIGSGWSNRASSLKWS